jgi:alkylhydroperoxidase family enzyme
MIAEDVHKKLHTALINGVLTAEGSTSREQRQAIIEASRAFTLEQPDHVSLNEPLRGYVEQVALRSHSIRDGDIERVRHAGHTDDALFEVTVAAAVGAGMARLDRVLALLDRALDPLEEVKAP